MTQMIYRLRARLVQPIPIQSLVALRILFGAILAWDYWRYVKYDRIERYYVRNELTFPYFGLDFLQPLPEPWIHYAWAVVGLSAVLVMIGAFYRVAILAFILSFGYFFLLDRTQYLNHNYMVLLYAILLAVSPANRAWSVDAWLRPGLASRMIPRWPVSAIRLQTEIILIYAGIVKINDDWLRGEPLRMWMHARMDDVLIAPIFQWDWVVMTVSVGVIVLHIVGAPLLLWHRTRLAVFAIYCAFHVSNAIFFNIGIFPWLTIAVTLIFFPPDWPQRLARRALGLFEDLPPMPSRPHVEFPRLAPAMLAFLALWFAVQLALPARQGLFPNLVGWTGDGHRFSWRMRIYDRDAEGLFEVRAPDGTETWYIDPAAYLSRRQARAVLTRPDLIHDFALFLQGEMAARGIPGAEVRATIRKSLNGRPPQLYVDPQVDLARAGYSLFGPDDWVLPLRTRAAEGLVAGWWPPLPLQRPAEILRTARAD